MPSNHCPCGSYELIEENGKIVCVDCQNVTTPINNDHILEQLKEYLNKIGVQHDA